MSKPYTDNDRKDTQKYQVVSVTNCKSKDKSLVGDSNNNQKDSDQHTKFQNKKGSVQHGEISDSPQSKKASMHKSSSLDKSWVPDEFANQDCEVQWTDIFEEKINYINPSKFKFVPNIFSCLE